jgi:hypothetical protein
MDRVNAVPDDVVLRMPVDKVRLAILDGSVRAVEVRFVGGELPLKIGERVEVEVVSIERTTVER